jgi:hypothetical protein
MTEQEPWFVQERAVAFASLILTEQDNVSVRHQDGSEAMDLLAEVRLYGKSTLRFFGVKLLAAVNLADAKAMALPPKAMEGVTLPVCIFVIGAAEPEGVWAWALEPVVEEAGAALRLCVLGDWQPLGRDTAAQVVKRVNAYYDALAGKQPARTRGRASATGS